MNTKELNKRLQSADEPVPVSVHLKDGRLHITGKFGTETAMWENPVQIGLAVLVACMGQQLCPPKPWVGAQEETNVQ